MKCPYCNSEDTQVKDSRPTEENAAIRRRRECPDCDARFTTFERVQLREMIVVKNDGRKEVFDRSKLLRSLMLPLQKRSIANEDIELFVNGIVRQLEQSGEVEIHASAIGEKVMGMLEGLDEVAYVRYASVYRGFDSVADYHIFLDRLAMSLSKKTGTKT